MKKTFRFLLLAVSLAILPAGCALLQGEDLSDEPVTDEGIAALAASRLNGDGMVARATLNVTVEDGRATLAGTVPNEATRQRALQILQATPGVSDVRDHTRKR